MATTATSLVAFSALCAFVLLSLFSSKAAAQTRTDGLYAATFAEHASATTFEVPYGSSTAHVRVGRRLSAPDSQVLYASDNANTHYHFAVTYREGHCRPDAVLLLAGTAAAVSGVGRDSQQCSYFFDVDRSQADRIAQSFGVVREDRSAVGERVTATFTTPATTYAPGAAMEIHVALRNPADALPVQREVGCCRFSLVLYRDGQRVSALQCGATACPVAYVPLASGASGNDTVDIGHWANIQTPGHYRVECTYQTNFAREGIPTFDSMSFAGRIWERVFTGVVEFEVR